MSADAAKMMSDLENRLADVLDGLTAARLLLDDDALEVAGNRDLASAITSLKWVAAKLEADAVAALNIVTDRPTSLR